MPVICSAEWLLYWTSRGVAVPQGFLPLLDEWTEIDSRERALGIEPGTPILIDPAGRIDPRLAYLLRRSRFAFLAEETKHAYAKDYRLFFSFLHQREQYWDEADYEDIDDYESWRRRSVDNPRRIGGSKWARELAAFKLLYGWAVAVGHIDRSPVLTHTVRRRDGTVVEIANNRPTDVRASPSPSWKSASAWTASSKSTPWDSKLCGGSAGTFCFPTGSASSPSLSAAASGPSQF